MIFLTPSIISLQVVGGNTSVFDAQTATANGKLLLSDHKRSPLSIQYDRIEKMSRMADGTARKQVISKKRNFSCSWEMLPTIKELVVDDNSDALDIKKFYEIYAADPLTLTIFHKKNSDTTTAYQDTYNVFFQSFDYNVVKRYRDFDYWNVNVEFTEI